LLKKKQGIKPTQKKETVQKTTDQPKVAPASGEVDEVQPVQAYTD